MVLPNERRVQHYASLDACEGLSQLMQGVDFAEEPFKTILFSVQGYF